MVLDFISNAGPDWMWGDNDGGPGCQGIVDGFHNEGREVLVVWKILRARSNYRWGQAFDIMVAH